MNRLHKVIRWVFMRRAVLRLWVLLLVLFGVLLLNPVRNGTTRAAWVASVVAFPLLTLCLIWKWRVGRWLLLVLSLACLGFLVAPGRAVDAKALRAEYLHQLRTYEGTRYVWGGESYRGVDCSGLLRASLMDAQFHQGVRTCNPGLVRAGLHTWWGDASASMLMHGEGGAVRVGPSFVLKEGSPLLVPGDMAVTADGSHVLAYLGQGEWIEADPFEKRVLRIRQEGASEWRDSKVVPCRWRCLQAGQADGADVK